MKQLVKVPAVVEGHTLLDKTLVTVVDLWIPDNQDALEEHQIQQAKDYWHQKFAGAKLAGPLEVRPLPASNAV